MNCHAVIDPRPDVINLTLKTIFKQLHLRLDFIDLLVDLIDLLVDLIDLSFDFRNLSLDFVNLCINSFYSLFNLYYPYGLGSIIIIQVRR